MDHPQNLHGANEPKKHNRHQMHSYNAWISNMSRTTPEGAPKYFL